MEHTKELLEALVRAERKLSAYVGVCSGDKELTNAVLPMARAAIEKVREKAPDQCTDGGKCGVGGYCETCHQPQAPEGVEPNGDGSIYDELIQARNCLSELLIANNTDDDLLFYRVIDGAQMLLSKDMPPRLHDSAAQLAAITAERDQYRDMAQDYSTQLELIREAMGVQYEPHQTLMERTLEAAQNHDVLKKDAETAWAQAHRLALELECLLMDTKDLPTVSKWWDSANEALEQHRAAQQEAMRLETLALAKIDATKSL